MLNGKLVKTLKKFTTKQLSLEDHKKELQQHWEWCKNHPILSWLQQQWYCLPDRPRDIKNFFKWGIQRWRRGWSDYDSWDIDEYLIHILVPMLQKLKKNKWGIPCEVFNQDDPIDETGNFTNEAVENAKKRWDEILDKIIKTFHIAHLIKEGNWIYISSDQWTQEKFKDCSKRLSNHVIMDLETVKKYEEGWALFQKHFFSLWD